VNASGAERREDSSRRRFVFKLAGNVLGLGQNLVVSAVVPRGLGPVVYGNYAFLTTFFSQLMSFVETGAQAFFFVRVSQKPDDAALVRFYHGFVGLIFLVMAAFVGLVYAGGVNGWMWPHLAADQVLAVMLVVFSTWSVTSLGQLVDAHGWTVKGEVARLWERAARVLVILLIYGLGWIRFRTYIFYLLAMNVLLAYLWRRVLTRGGVAIPPRAGLTAGQVSSYAGDLWRFSSPMILYNLVAALTMAFDRWMLQRSGALQQGYFGLASQVGGLGFLFMGALAPIILRDFSKHVGEENVEGVKNRFRRYGPFLYCMASLVACFLCVHADGLVSVFGGKEYAGAAPALALMALYSVHQTYGHLAYSVFMAMGKTRAYCRLGFAPLLVGVVVTWFLIGPAAWGGGDGGATGLAVKFILTQFIAVNVNVWAVSGYLGLSFTKILGHQVVVAALWFALGWTCRVAAAGAGFDGLTGMVASSVLYGAGAAVSIVCVPQLLGWSRRDMKTEWERVRNVPSGFAT
jgi:O-antigen/teichoic acid export membrane protein